MEELTSLLLEWGLLGLLVAAFTESFISPILPDVILIPLALAHHENAIWYGLFATFASVVGGLIGYWIGAKVGVQAARRMVPEKYLSQVQNYVSGNAIWAVWLAAMAPIPYKFVSITAGALRIPLPVFLVASFFGRAKRFMIEGILIFYFGPAAIELFNRHSNNVMIGSGVAVVVICVVIYLVKRAKKKSLSVEAVETTNL